MNIRTSLIIWFLVAALVPSAAIALFFANDASDRFYAQAREELKEATDRGREQFDEIRLQVRRGVELVAQSEPMLNYLNRRAELDSAPLIDADLATTISERVDSRLDFIKIIGPDGTVISSKEWLVFAGKTDLEWPELAAMPDDRFLAGPVRTDAETPRLGIRYLLHNSGYSIIGGVTLTESDLNRFGAAKDIIACIYNGIEGKLIRNDTLDALTLRIVEREIIEESNPESIAIDGENYLVGSFPLAEQNPPPGAVIFLYSTAPLNEEIQGLWISFMITAAAGVILATLLGVIVSATVSQPLKALLHAFELVSLGDFTHKLKTRRKDELGEILRSFNDTTDNLQRLQKQLVRSERVAAWQEIARKIAHEIKNPLSPIQISIETMRKVHERKHPDFDRIFGESTVTILEEVDKIRTIVQEFSDFARMPEPHFEKTSIRDILSRLATLYEHQLENVEWQMDLPEELPAVFADAKQLQRAFMNLIKNALEAMPDGGRLMLEATYQQPLIMKRRGTRRAGKIIITLSDTGVGMTAEDQAKVFTPYFTTKDSGTGLGLVIVQKIVELHQGGLSLRSEKGEGTAVTVSLPEYIP